MASALKVAVQMDPIEHINIDADSTFALMLEAQRRGHALWHYEVRHMALREGVRRQGERREERLLARVRPVTVERKRGAHYAFGEPTLLDLATMDVVLMRQDPPFDMAYITATHLLEHIHPKTLVVNDPAAVRNAPEKLLVTHFPELMPPTMITWDLEAIRSFRREYQDIIVKPLFGNGGAGVFRIKPDDENLAALLEMHFARSREPLMFQRYEPAVRQGDKRIILVDGEPVGVVNRVPAAGEARSNMHVGGRPEKMHAVRPRPRDLCRDRPDAARAGHDLRRHRRDRRLADRDQRHLADRHPGDRPFRRHQHRGDDLGPHRGQSAASANRRLRPRRSCARWRQRSARTPRPAADRTRSDWLPVARTNVTNAWFNASSQNAAVKARKRLSRLRTQNRAKNSPPARNPAVTMPARNMLTTSSFILTSQMNPYSSTATAANDVANRSMVRSIVGSSSTSAATTRLFTASSAKHSALQISSFVLLRR